MNRRQKPVFHYIPKKETPNVVVQSDNTLFSKNKRLQKNCPEIKQIESGELISFKEQDKKEKVSKQNLRDLKSTQTFRKASLKKNTTTLVLFDRIEKQPFTIRLNYVERSGYEENAKDIDVLLNREKGETGLGLKQSLIQTIKMEEEREKKRVSINTRMRFGTLVGRGFSLINQINNLNKLENATK